MVARLGFGLRRRILDKRIVDCADTASDRPWQGPLAALAEVMAEFAAPNASATVILSNCFVRYAVVPWRDGVANRKEQLALAAHCFKNVYGDRAGDWDIRVSDDGFRRNSLACAVDRGLLTQLDELFAERGVSLASVQPYFMTACNRFRKELESQQSGCIALLERGRVTLGIFDRSGWQALTVRRVAEISADTLAPLLAQEFDSANLAALPEHVFVAALEHPGLDFAIRGWSTRMLQLKPRNGFSPLEDARYALALCGAA